VCIVCFVRVVECVWCAGRVMWGELFKEPCANILHYTPHSDNHNTLHHTHYPCLPSTLLQSPVISPASASCTSMYTLTNPVASMHTSV
jgi:hypothetical protein